MNRHAEMTVTVAGVGFQSWTTREAVGFLPSLVADSRHGGLHLHFLNAYSLALADSDPSLKQVLNDSQSICLPDGKPVVWASIAARHGRRLEQVRGPGFFRFALESSVPGARRHYLLGGTPAVLEALEKTIRRDYGNAEIVGAESPPFRALDVDERAAQANRIRATGADIVWLGLGTPKQDFEAARISSEVDCLVVGVGAAFDFVAGAIPEAPDWVQLLAMEWLFRLVSEPKRLWRRYTLGSARFLWAAVRGGRS